MLLRVFTLHQPIYDYSLDVFSFVFISHIEKCNKGRDHTFFSFREKEKECAINTMLPKVDNYRRRKYGNLRMKEVVIMIKTRCTVQVVTLTGNQKKL